DMGLQQAVKAVARQADELGTAFIRASADDLIVTTEAATSRLHRRIFTEAQQEYSRIVKAQPDLVGKEAIDLAFRRNRKIPVPRPDSNKWDWIDPRKVAKENGVEDLGDDAVWFVGVDEIVDELDNVTTGLNWLGTMRNDIVGIVARKEYHAQDDIWRDWIDHTVRQSKVNPTNIGSQLGGRLGMTTGGLTYGIPFSKQQQMIIPGLTELTRGVVSKRTRALRAGLTRKAPWLDRASKELGAKLSVNSQRVRIAEVSGIRTGIDQNSITTFAQFASLEDVRTVFAHSYTDIAGATISSNMFAEFTKNVSGELKDAGIKKRKGGVEAMDAINAEVNKAWASHRDPDLRAIGLPFVPTPALSAQASDLVRKIRIMQTSTEERMALLLPEVAHALERGLKYTPVFESYNGKRILSLLANGQGGQDSFTSMITDMRKKMSTATKKGDFDEAVGEVVESINREAKRKGYIEEDVFISSHEVLLFFSMLDEVNGSAAILPISFGNATTLRTRRTGRNAMFVYTDNQIPELTGVFQDPSVMNTKLSAIAHTLTDTMPNTAEFDGLWKRANGSIFETDPSQLINHWFTAANEAIVERLDAGIMLRTGMASRGEAMLVWSQFAQVLEADLAGSTRMVALRELVNHVRIVAESDELHAAAIARGQLDRSVIPVIDVHLENDVVMHVPADIGTDPVVAESVQEIIETAKVIARDEPTAPDRFQSAVSAVMSDRDVSDLEAQRIVLGDMVEALNPQLGKFDSAVKAAVHRKYAAVIEQAEKVGDADFVEVLEQSAISETKELEEQLATLWRDMAKSLAGVSDKAAPSPGGTRNLSSAGDINDFIKEAQTVLGKSSKSYRESQIKAIDADMVNLAPGSVHAHNATVEREMLVVAQEMSDLAEEGRIPWDTVKISPISGGQDGVDMYTVRRANAVGMDTGGTVPKGFVDDEARALGRNVAETVDEQTRLGMTPIEGEYKGQKAGSYPARTMKNVDDGTVTVVYMPGAGGKRFVKGQNVNYFQGGSADTIHYARTGNWPEYPEGGAKQTFTDKQLPKLFQEIADGVWVPLDVDEFHRPVMIIGFVAHPDGFQGDLYRASRQHHAIREFINQNAQDGKLVPNFAGPREYVHDLSYGPRANRTNLPMVLDPADPDAEALTHFIRWGALTDKDGTLVVAPEAGPRFQTAQEIVTRYNAFIRTTQQEGIDAGIPIPGKGSSITVEDLIEWNLESVDFIERTSDFINNVLSIKSMDTKRLTEVAVAEGIDVVAVARSQKWLAGGTGNVVDPKAYEAAIVAEIAKKRALQKSPYQVGGRIFGQLSHQSPSPQLRGVLQETHGTFPAPLGKVKTPNEHNVGIVNRLWELYKDMVPEAARTNDVLERYEVLSEMQRGMSSYGRIHDDVPQPFDYIETVVTADTPDPVWLVDKYGTLLGADTAAPSPDGWSWEAARALDPTEVWRIRAVAEMHQIPNPWARDPYDLIGEIRSKGLSMSQ
ncbi:MAG: hypothetical protein DRH08_07120, partial [Deltaproteobacteria bacterium]